MHLIILRLVRAILIFLWLSHKSDISSFVGNRMTCFLKGRLNSLLNFTGALFQRRKSSKDKLSRLLNFIKKKKKESFGKETLEKKFNICLLPSSTLPVTGGIVKKIKQKLKAFQIQRWEPGWFVICQRKKNIGPKCSCNWNNRAFKLVCHY